MFPVCVCCPDSGPWFISSCLSSHFLTHFSLPVCLRTSFHLCLSPLVPSSVGERAFWECEWGNTRLISSFVSPTHVKLFRERRWSSGVCVWVREMMTQAHALLCIERERGKTDSSKHVESHTPITWPNLLCFWLVLALAWEQADPRC